MKLLKILFNVLLTIFFISACGGDIDKKYLEKNLFSGAGEKGYEINGITQGIDALKSEYELFINLNYPTNIKKLAKVSLENWRDFIDKRQKQDLIIVDALKSNTSDTKIFKYFLKQGIRDAIVKAYLYQKIPNVEKIKDAQFSDDRVFLEKIYQKNKKLYDEKNIKKEEAIKALRVVYAKKKRAIIDYILQKEQTKVIQNLQKKFKVDESKRLNKNPLAGIKNEK